MNMFQMSKEFAILKQKRTNYNRRKSKNNSW